MSVSSLLLSTDIRTSDIFHILLFHVARLCFSALCSYQLRVAHFHYCSLVNGTLLFFSVSVVTFSLTRGQNLACCCEQLVL